MATRHPDARIPPHRNLTGLEVRDGAGGRVGAVCDAVTDGRGGYVRLLDVATGPFGTRRVAIPVDGMRMEMAGADTWLVAPDVTVEQGGVR